MAKELYLWFSHKHLLYFPVFINFKWINDKSSVFMGCNVVTIGVQFPTFCRITVPSFSFSSSPRWQCHIPEELNLQQRHFENFKDDLIFNTHAAFCYSRLLFFELQYFQTFIYVFYISIFKFLELSKHFILKINSSVRDTFISPSSSWMASYCNW